MELKLPYPAKIFYDIGDSFITGISLGSVYYLIKGLYMSERKHKLKSTLNLITNKAPIIGGNFASWSLIYNISYYGALSLRKKQDIFNPFFACFSAGSIFHIRKGWRPAIKNGLNSCLYLGLIESSIFLFQKYQRKIMIKRENDILKKYKKKCENEGIIFRKINNLI